MHTGFRAGRLIVTKDNVVKKLELAAGGGTRNCELSHIDMGFDEIHDKLRDIFGLKRSKVKTRLYDFKQNELDTNRYRTFFEYINKNGLKFNGTLLYLCNRADSYQFSHSKNPKRTKPMKRSQPMKRKNRTPSIKIEPTITPDVVQIDDDVVPPSDHTLANIRRLIDDLQLSYSNYSFEKSLNQLVNYIRHVITRHPHENLLILLFEHICTIHGLSSMTLDSLKQLNQSINQYDKKLQDERLNKIRNLSQTVQVLIDLNKMKLNHIDQDSIIMKSFNKFYQNFQTACDDYRNNENNNTVRRRTYPTNATSSNSYFSSHSTEISLCQYRSETHTRQTNRSSSRQKSDRDDRHISRKLFSNIIKSFKDFLRTLKQLNYYSFCYVIREIICEIETNQKDLKLSEYKSIDDWEKRLIDIEKRLTNRMNHEYQRVSPHKIDPLLEKSYDKTLDTIRNLTNSFHHYKSRTENKKRTKSTRWSSTTIEQEHTETKSNIGLNQELTRISNNIEINKDEDDQSSEASHSSVDDVALMEVAKNAYENRIHRH